MLPVVALVLNACRFVPSSRVAACSRIRRWLRLRLVRFAIAPSDRSLLVSLVVDPVRNRSIFPVLVPELSEFFKCTKGLLWKCADCNDSKTSNTLLNSIEEFMAYNFNKFMVEIKQDLDSKFQVLIEGFLRTTPKNCEGIVSASGSAVSGQPAFYAQVASEI